MFFIANPGKIFKTTPLTGTCAKKKNDKIKFGAGQWLI
jgi:hypothetical protein